jgi:hypothetical protein
MGGILLYHFDQFTKIAKIDLSSESQVRLNDGNYQPSGTPFCFPGFGYITQPKCRKF